MSERKNPSRIGEALVVLGSVFAEKSRDLETIGRCRDIIHRELVGFPDPYLHTTEGHATSTITRHDSIRGVLRDLDDRLIKPYPNGFQVNVKRNGANRTGGDAEYFVGFPQKTIPTDVTMRRPYVFVWVDKSGYAAWGWTHYGHGGRLATRLAMSAAVADAGSVASLVRFLRRERAGTKLVWKNDVKKGGQKFDVDTSPESREKTIPQSVGTVQTWARVAQPFVAEVVDDREWLRTVPDGELRYRVTSLLGRLAKDLLLPAIKDADRSEYKSVFLSYRRRDGVRSTVAELAHTLEQRGIEVFWDDELDSGDRWRLRIAERVESAWLVCCLVGEEYVAGFEGREPDAMRDLEADPDWCFVELEQGSLPRAADGKSRLELVATGDRERVMRRLEGAPDAVRRIFDDNQMSSTALAADMNPSAIRDLAERIDQRLDAVAAHALA